MSLTDLLAYGAIALLLLAALGAVADWIERPRPESTDRRAARRRNPRPTR